MIMLSGSADVPSAVQALKMGAVDFLQKPFRAEQLLEVIHKAFEIIDSAAEKERMLKCLTPRERDVLKALCSGASNKVVARQLGLSPRTVEMHRARIFKKLDVTNLAQALLRTGDSIHN